MYVRVNDCPYSRSKWRTEVRIGGRHISRYFPCGKTDDANVEAQLEKAIHCLASELLPMQAAVQRTQLGRQADRESGMRFVSWNTGHTRVCSVRGLLLCVIVVGSANSHRRRNGS